MKYTRIVRLDVPLEEVFAFCSSPYGFEKHFPHPIRWVTKLEEWSLGSYVDFKFRFLFMWWYCKMEITGYERNNFFVDVLRTGLPYKYLYHYHLFEANDGITIYTDRIEFSFGFGSWLDKTIGKLILNSLFTKRHVKLKKYLEKNGKSK